MANVKANYNKAGQIISYRFRACIGRDETTGKQLFATKTVPAPVDMTPGKAMKRMQTEADLWESEVRKGNAPVQRLSFKYFIEEQFIPVFVCNGKHSPSTIKFYKDICAKLVKEFGHKKLDGIKSLDIERYLVDMTKETYERNGKEKQYSATYINQHRTVLTVAFNFAEKHSMIEKNPMRFISAVKKERKEVDFLNEEEAIHFLSCLNEKATMYWKTAMNVLIRCGLRRGELAGLKWQDINFADNMLTVCRDVINNKETEGKNVVKETKSEKSDRVIPVDPALIALLKSWQKEQSEQFGAKLMPSAFIFGNQIDPYQPNRPDNITQWLARFNKANGFRSFSPHDLRHTCATLMLSHQSSIVEVQHILGHSKPDTTLNYYCGTDADALRNASNRLAQVLAMAE